jgi:hypothetical protein
MHFYIGRKRARHACVIIVGHDISQYESCEIYSYIAYCYTGWGTIYVMIGIHSCHNNDDNDVGNDR